MGRADKDLQIVSLQLGRVIMHVSCKRWLTKTEDQTLFMDLEMPIQAKVKQLRPLIKLTTNGFNQSNEKSLSSIESVKSTRK